VSKTWGLVAGAILAAVVAGAIYEYEHSVTVVPHAPGEERFPVWGAVAAHPGLNVVEVRCREGAPSSDGTLVAIEASIYTASALQISAAIYTVTGTNSYTVLAEAGTGQAASVGLNRIAMPPTPLTAGTAYAVCIRSTGTSGGMDSGSAAGTEDTTRYCNASAAAFPMFPAALSCSLHFGLSDLIAGVYTPNAANEARFGSTMTGTPTTVTTVSVVNCRSAVPASSGTLVRIEAQLTAAAGRMVRAGIYSSDAAGLPSMLLAQSGPVSISGVFPNEAIDPFPLTGHVTAGTRYWICVLGNSSTGVVWSVLTNEGIAGMQATASFAAGFDSVFTVNTAPGSNPQNRDSFIAGVYTPNVANEARFGSTMTGTPLVASVSVVNCTGGVPASSGTLLRIETRTSPNTLAGMIRSALYSSNSLGEPSVLIAQSSPIAIAEATAALYQMPVAATLQGGTTYWLCVLGDGLNRRIDYVDGPGFRDLTSGEFASGFPMNFTPTATGFELFIRGVYTPNAGPGTHRALIIGGGVF
jgi:hypothetical protein